MIVGWKFAKVALFVEQPKSLNMKQLKDWFSQREIGAKWQFYTLPLDGNACK